MHLTALIAIERTANDIKYEQALEMVRFIKNIKE